MRRLILMLGGFAGGLLLNGAALAPPAGASGDPNRLTVIGEVDETKLVPIAISGFDGKVATVLRFDLEVQGFKIVPKASAKYILSGNNDGVVEGALQDANQAFLFNKTFNGGTLRMQAHTLSDTVVQAVHGVRGIARTKILYTMKTGARAW